MGIINKIKGAFSTPFTALFSFGDRNHSYKWTRNNSLSYYEKSLFVNKAITKRAEKVGHTKFRLLDQRGDEVENEWTELLRKPNKWQTGGQFWGLVQKYYDVVGAAYILPHSDRVLTRNSVPDRLEILRADLVEPIVNQAGNEILRFEYHKDGKVQKYDPEEIIYIYRPDPRNPLLGESLIASGIRELETGVQIAEYQTNVLKNGGKLDNIFSVKGVSSKERLDELEQQYSEKHAQAKNAGRPVFMPAESIDIKSMGLTPNELAYLDTKISSLNDIVVMTGVPKVILGVGSQETFANAEAEIRTWYRDSITPMVDERVEILNWRLVSDQFELNYEDPTPEDREEKRKDAEAVKEIATLNERRELFGLDPDPDPTKIYAPINIAPLERSETQDQRSVKKNFHPLRDKEYRRKYHDMKLKQIDGHQRWFMGEVRKFFESQRDRILENLTDTHDVEAVFHIEDEKQKTETAFKDIFERLVIRAGEEATEFVNSFQKTGGFRITSDVRVWITARVALFASEITETTQNQLVEQFGESFDQGEDRRQLERRIRETYDGFATTRARTIARTEVHGAVQKGTLEAYRQSEVPIKIWVATFQNTRDAHAAADGQEVAIDQPFTVGGESIMFPGDGSPGNSINCQCSI